jgi:hypothetical protein
VALEVATLFFDRWAVSSLSVLGQAEGLLAVLFFVLDIARHGYVLSTSFAAKTGGCIYRLSQLRGLLGHSMTSFFEKAASNQ